LLVGRLVACAAVDPCGIALDVAVALAEELEASSAPPPAVESARGPEAKSGIDGLEPIGGDAEPVASDVAASPDGSPDERVAMNAMTASKETTSATSATTRRRPWRTGGDGSAAGSSTGVPVGSVELPVTTVGSTSEELPASERGFTWPVALGVRRPGGNPGGTP
jgi:hypothetical protein